MLAWYLIQCFGCPVEHDNDFIVFILLCLSSFMISLKLGVINLKLNKLSSLGPKII